MAGGFLCQWQKLPGYLDQYVQRLEVLEEPSPRTVTGGLLKLSFPTGPSEHMFVSVCSEVPAPEPRPAPRESCGVWKAGEDRMVPPPSGCLS
jgi:hypothetical protein